MPIQMIFPSGTARHPTASQRTVWPSGIPRHRRIQKRRNTDLFTAEALVDVIGSATRDQA